MSEMSSIQDSLQMKLDQLECHFTWDIKKDDVDLPNLLSRLKEQDELDLGREEGAARAQCSLGYVKFLLGLEDEALEHLLRSETLIKENLSENCEKTLIVTYGNLAWINYHMKNYTKCESYLMKLQKITETYPTESSSIPEVLGEKGWAYLKFSRKYYAKAAEVFQKAVELDPENSEWNAGYAITLYRTEDGTVDSPAIKQLRRAIEINPDDDVLRVLLGLKLMLCSKMLKNESEKLVETALNGSPEHPHVMRYVGIFFRDQGSVDSAIEMLNKASEISPNSCFIHHQLAMCYKTKKINLTRENRNKIEIDKARDKSIYHLEMATSQKASFIIAMSELALQYGEKRYLQKAEELFDLTFKTATEKNEHLQVVHLNYAQFQQYCNRCEDSAIEHYKTCLTMGPNTKEGTRSAWKLVKIAKGRIKCDPNDWKGHEILGLLYNIKGNIFNDSEGYADTLANDENGEFLNNLGELLSQ
ncbi:interferon-induced protein with tetratricopeptide repeats 5-like [Garra rufa]|uniref:interferon-induced protein with tetratricopeptide repeats 5-like n=1 Tax=Garra rufa TaxID=137080 RepID=UPI003CCEB840